VGISSSLRAAPPRLVWPAASDRRSGRQRGSALSLRIAAMRIGGGCPGFESLRNVRITRSLTMRRSARRRFCGGGGGQRRVMLRRVETGLIVVYRLVRRRADGYSCRLRGAAP